MPSVVENWSRGIAERWIRSRVAPVKSAGSAAGSSLLHHHFERQADARPESVAVLSGEEHVTYGELDRYANRIARRLRALGVRRGARVALLLPRSVDAYAAMLGILKAGAAYVPLDPEWPTERVAFILGDADADALITTSPLAQDHAAYDGALIRLDDDVHTITAEAATRLTASETGVTPRDLCYIIYTSGSTGRPKGVMIEHRSADHLVRVEGELFGVEAYDRVLQSASLTFDLSVEEVWLAFGSGATLVPATPEMLHAGPDLGRLLADAGVTVVSCVPTLLAMLPTDVPAVRLLILGGEVCPESLVQRWVRDGRRVFNTYGPTEATVTTTFLELAPGRPVTIGRPLPGYTVHVLDEHLRAVPHGRPGEICVGGPGVARGYVGLGEQTRERFVRDPFDGAPGARLYRTGDIGRVAESGEIEFVGRNDGQVKLRGYRIELPEIEAAMLAADGVLAAACAVREDTSGLEHLVGYVVMRDGTPPDAERIRAVVRSRLPAYMVPALIAPIDVLPQLSSGKLDRAALPAPEGSAEALPDAGRPPRSDLERKLTTLWRSLFAPLPVSIDDHFFLDLGGHSMLAARMVSELRKDPRFARVSMVAVYDHPTIAKLAAVLDAEAAAPAHAANGTRPVAPRSPAAGHPRLRHALAGLAQAVGLYFPLGSRAVQWTAPYLVFFGLLAVERPLGEAIAWAALTYALLFPALLAVTVAAKWIVLGRIRPGRYQLWGTYHLRWWFVNALTTAIPFEFLGGTPLLPFVYRLFGAKIGRDVHIATEHLAAFDLISIGDESCIDDEASLAGAEVEDGELIIGPVTVGRGCFVGTRSVLREGTVLEDGARLEDLTFVPRGVRIPAGATWAGSPARSVDAPPLDLPPHPVHGRVRRAATAALYAVLVGIIPLVMLISAAPGLSILLRLDPLTQPLLFLAILPLLGALFAGTLATIVVLLKWILVGRVRAGRYPVHGGFYVRNWVVDQLLKLGLDMLGPIHATLYAPTWYRALGAKLGRFVEFSTASATTPDLVEIADGGTIADEVSLGSARVERGWMTLALTRVGERAFAGNSSVVPSGATIGDRSLIGVLSLAPTRGVEAGANDTAWLGSPPLRLPRRQPSASFPDTRTYAPSRGLRTLRRFVEIFRVTVPSAAFILVSATVITATFVAWEWLGLTWALALLPVTYAAVSLVALFGVASAKWLIDGRFERFVHPLWSLFVWRLEFVNALYEFFATPIILDTLRGTPFLPWCLRLLGARIGRRTYIDTTGFLEFDLVEIGDEAVLNGDCVIQTHLFEDRVLKASRVRIGERCVVGTSSVVLYDSVMEPGARLDALSLIMKGETLPAGTSWAGVPATWRDWRDWRDWPDNAPARAPDITPAHADDAVRSGSAA